MSVNSTIKEIKKQTSKLEGDVADAKRLVKLLERAGEPVSEHKVRVNQMESKLNQTKSALKKDKKEYVDGAG